MSVLNRLNIGIVGVCGGYGRGGHMAPVLNSVAPVRVHALCDVDRERLDKANEQLKVGEVYYSMEEMLTRSDLDAVFLATPMHLHAPQAVMALRRGLHVLCEVTAATDVQQCRDLVAAAKASQAVYMMAENYNYQRPVAAVREMVRRGLFGEVYYAEGGYVADIKGLAELTPWRRKWQAGINGITYITHNLGPMLQWMPSQRVTAVSCIGAGRRYVDPRGLPYEAEAACSMLGRTSGGGQVLIRSDFLSNRPGIGVYNDLQGTDGCYESPRHGGEPHRVWLKSLSESPTWTDLATIEGKYLPESMSKALAENPHWGPDHFQVAEFVSAIQGKGPHPLDVHESMDLTLPGLMSQLSADAAGAWMDVPDTRTW